MLTYLNNNIKNKTKQEKIKIKKINKKKREEYNEDKMKEEIYNNLSRTLIELK